jgi:hypothetical protein
MSIESAAITMKPRDSRMRVIGPYGEPITLADLPPPSTKRWVIRRKAVVVAAVRGGLLSLDEACRRYTLSVEEFLSWQRAIESHGLPGLRTTRIQLYRDADEHKRTREAQSAA